MASGLFQTNLLWLIYKTHVHIEIFVWTHWRDTKAAITCGTKILKRKKDQRGESNIYICFSADLLIWKWQLSNCEANQTFQECLGVAEQALESMAPQREGTIENTAGFQLEPW